MQCVSGTKPRIRWNQKLRGRHEIRNTRGEENKRLHQELLKGLANGLRLRFVEFTHARTPRHKACQLHPGSLGRGKFVFAVAKERLHSVARLLRYDQGATKLVSR